MEQSDLFYETREKLEKELEKLEKEKVEMVSIESTIIDQALEIARLKEEVKQLKNINNATKSALENLQNAIYNMCYHLERNAIHNVETIDKVISCAKMTPNQQELDILNFIRDLVVDRAEKIKKHKAEIDAYRR